MKFNYIFVIQCQSIQVLPLETKRLFTASLLRRHSQFWPKKSSIHIILQVTIILIMHVEFFDEMDFSKKMLKVHKTM